MQFISCTVCNFTAFFEKKTKTGSIPQPLFKHSFIPCTFLGNAIQFLIMLLWYIIYRLTCLALESIKPLKFHYYIEKKILKLHSLHNFTFQFYNFHPFSIMTNKLQATILKFLYIWRIDLEYLQYILKQRLELIVLTNYVNFFFPPYPSEFRNQIKHP